MSKKHPDNRGFSILEVVFCILLLTFGTTGFISMLIYNEHQEAKDYYEFSLYSNMKTILELCDIETDDRFNNLSWFYEKSIISKNDKLIIIEIMLEKEYHGLNSIIYEITLNETDSYYETIVKVNNVYKDYEGVNNSEINKRIHQK